MQDAPPPASGALLSRAGLDLLAEATVVADATRALVTSNERFDLEIGRGGGDTCCDVVGCAQVTGGGCITRLVLAERRPWQGTVTTRGSDTPRELVATALGAGAAHVVFRFAEPRAGVSGHPALPQLHIWCLGPLRIGRDTALEAPAWLDQRPGTMLKYLLAMRHRHVSTDELLETIWEPGSVSPGSVRYVVHQLRTRLERAQSPAAPPPEYIRKTSRGYRLDVSTVWTDADAFEAAVRTAVTAAVRGDMHACELHVLRALRLYRGDFLQDAHYAEWSLSERNRLHALLETPLRLLIDVRIAAGDLEGAVTHAERLANHEPLDADIQRTLLELLLRLGRGSRAMRHYEVYRARLWRVLGVDPSFDISDLRRHLP